MNTIILKGRLTKDPELKATQSGISICRFCVAVNRRFNKDEADFINCLAWRGTAEFISKYFKKGQEICLSGALTVNRWENEEGKSEWSSEVTVDNAEFCGSKAEKSENNVEQSADTVDPLQELNATAEDLAEELPF